MNTKAKPQTKAQIAISEALSAQAAELHAYKIAFWAIQSSEKPRVWKYTSRSGEICEVQTLALWRMCGGVVVEGGMVTSTEQWADAARRSGDPYREEIADHIMRAMSEARKPE